MLVCMYRGYPWTTVHHSRVSPADSSLTTQHSPCWWSWFNSITLNLLLSDNATTARLPDLLIKACWEIQLDPGLAGLMTGKLGKWSSGQTPRHRAQQRENGYDGNISCDAVFVSGRCGDGDSEYSALQHHFMETAAETVGGKERHTCYVCKTHVCTQCYR